MFQSYHGRVLNVYLSSQALQYKVDFKWECFYVGRAKRLQITDSTDVQWSFLIKETSCKIYYVLHYRRNLKG